MALSSEQQERAKKLAAEIGDVSVKIRRAADPPLGSSAEITRTSNQGTTGILSQPSDSLGDVLKEASADLSGLAQQIDQLLREDAQ